MDLNQNKAVGFDGLSCSRVGEGTTVQFASNVLPLVSVTTLSGGHAIERRRRAEGRC